jgi:hypothetical protein
MPAREQSLSPRNNCWELRTHVSMPCCCYGCPPASALARRRTGARMSRIQLESETPNPRPAASGFERGPFRTIARALEHPWNKTLSLWGDFQEFPGRKAIESSGIMERAMGIEPTSEAWETWTHAMRVNFIAASFLSRGRPAVREVFATACGHVERGEKKNRWAIRVVAASPPGNIA